MDLKLNETSEIWGSKECDHKVAVFYELMSHDRVKTLMMEAAVSSEVFVHVCQCTRHCLPGDIILRWNRWGKNIIASVYVFIG